MKEENLPIIFFILIIIAILFAVVNLYFYFSQVSKVPRLNVTLDQSFAGQNKIIKIEAQGEDKLKILCESARDMLQLTSDPGERTLIIKYLELCANFFPN